MCIPNKQNTSLKMSYFGYIEPRELAEQLRSEAVAVIDVRDEDFDEDGSLFFFYYYSNYCCCYYLYCYCRIYS